MTTHTLSPNSTLPDWSAKWAPIYDITRSYQENAAEGPFFSQKIPQRVFPAKEKWIPFLGHRVASTIGIPAGPLLNSNYVKLAANLGYDLITYKTIRTQAHPSHPLPNVLFVDAEGGIATPGKKLHPLEHPPQTLSQIAITNSFGMPSMDSEYLRKDIPKALEALHEGQLLIVSVVGTPHQGKDFVEDFVAAARLAVECGAPVVEANFSCPNVTTGEGALYQDPVIVATLSKRLTKALGSIPLIIKVGTFDSEEQMRSIFQVAADAGVRAISGINTVSVSVENRDGTPSLGPTRLTSGLCGDPIRAIAISFIQTARKVIDEEGLGLTLLGVGGITAPEHIDNFYKAGAEAALTATGMMWDPFLALRYHQHKEIG